MGPGGRALLGLQGVVELPNHSRAWQRDSDLTRGLKNQPEVLLLVHHEETGAKIVIMPEWVNGVPEASDCFACFDYMVNSIVDALSETSADGG